MIIFLLQLTKKAFLEEDLADQRKEEEEDNLLEQVLYLYFSHLIFT